MVALNINSASNFIEDKVLDAYMKKASDGFDTLMKGNGSGNAFLGWIKLPEEIDNLLLDRCENLHQKWMS